MTKNVVKSQFILPNEIQDRILDFLYDPKSALETCALVCRAWVPASRYHLFSRIRLDDWDLGISDHPTIS